MRNLIPAETELNQAKDQLQMLEIAIQKDPFDKAELHWRNFLNHLDKSWIKTIYGCGELKGILQKIRSDVGKKQKNDPLIRYLCQARDADNHSIQKLTDFDELENKPQIPIVFYGEDDTGERVREVILFNEIKFVVTSFINRGVVVLPPEHHLGHNLKGQKDPVALGRLGIQFYEKIINDIKKLI